MDAVEVFPPFPPARPHHVFYTITTMDVGKLFIETSVGTIPLSEVIGRVLESDVGKRLYGTWGRAGHDRYYWGCESNAQRDARLAKNEKES